jgi:O-antigen/teichoic acid export membrane protein
LQQPERRNLSTVVVFWLLGLLASLAVAAFQLRHLPWAGAFASRLDPAAVWRGLRTAVPFFVTTGSVMAILFVDRFIIEAFHGLSRVGVYTFFASITTGIHQLVNTSLTLTRVPDLVRAHKSRDGRFGHEVRTLAREAAILSLVLASTAAVCIHPVLRFIGKPVYEDAIPVFLILLGGAVARCIADVPLYALYAQRRDRIVMTANVAGAIISVALNLLLVPVCSLVGAAISALASSLVVFAVTLAALVPSRHDRSSDTAAVRVSPQLSR